MKERELMDHLKEKAVVSVQDIQRIGDFSREYAKLVMNRLAKRKLMKKITRNSYTMQKDILVIASNLKVPSYISFWSASSYYGFTEQILNVIYVACARKIKPITFEGYKIKFIKVKELFGYKKSRAGNGELFIVDQEKLLIDCVLHFEEMGNFDEIEKVFQKAEISREKSIEYLKKIKNLSLIKRVGYLLEKYKGIDLSKHFKIDRNYVYLNQFSIKYKYINPKWRVYL